MAQIDSVLGTSDGSLVRRFQAGEQSAATALFDRYAERVRQLAHPRCSSGYSARFDADDIVQSVFRSFFNGVRRETYQVPADGDLWGLLLVMALNKIRSHVDFHRAAKRAVSRTARQEDLEDWPLGDGSDPGSGFLRVVLDDLMDGLPVSNREIVRLRIDGHEVKEIAALTGRSSRTVERVLHDFRDRIADPE
jgi:RNA polymerase sigma-70 factor, ECF subfamily